MDSIDALNTAAADTAITNYWATVAEFAAEITRAARNALLNRRTTFQRVVAVVIYWEHSINLEHLRDQADALALLFKERFAFEVETYKIPDNVTDRKFVATVGDELDKVANDPNALFVLYYGGHAMMKDPTFDRRYWTKENSPRSPEIDWSSAIRSLFKTRVMCSKLFILDCCHAGGMIDSTLPWETSCELLGACAADVQASALRVSSFTRAVREEIEKNTYDIWELHSALCSTEKRERVYNLSKYPFYQDFMGHARQSTSTLLAKVGSSDTGDDRPRTPSDMLARLTNISDAVICIAVTFKCTGDVFMDELENFKKNWRRWLKFAPTECDEIIVKACRGAELVAAFNSNSCLTIWKFPVWLWDVMSPAKGSYQRLGIIRPQNLVLSGTSQPLDLAMPKRRMLPNVLTDPLNASNKPIKTQLSDLNGPKESKKTNKNHLLSAFSNLFRPNPGTALDQLRPPNFDGKGSPLITTYDLPDLVDMLQDAAEKKQASRIQNLRTPKDVGRFLSGIQQMLDSPEHARATFTVV